MNKKDVLIIGGGPAGSACAWRLKQNGADCLVLDGQAFPRFKPCAGWVTPGLLRDLDLTPEEEPTEEETAEGEAPAEEDIVLVSE